MFSKFLVTVGLIALVWYGFRYAQRLGAEKAKRELGMGKGGEGAPRFTPDPDGASVQDLIKCPRCNTYRSVKLGSCGRDECPY